MGYMEKICCFFVFARVFLHMCPGEKYEKYIRVLTGWVALGIFLSPFLTGNWTGTDYSGLLRQWQSRVESVGIEKTEDMQIQSERIMYQAAEEMAKEETAEAEEEE